MRARLFGGFWILEKKKGSVPVFSHVMFMFFNATAVVLLASIITIVILKKCYAPFIKETEEAGKTKRN
jgi:hypothetical protein